MGKGEEDRRIYPIITIPLGLGKSEKDWKNKKIPIIFFVHAETKGEGRKDGGRKKVGLCRVRGGVNVMITILFIRRA